MKEHVYLINLFDYYGELLTEKQRQYFEEYYFQNLTLQEIADNNSISRNAAFKQIKNACNKLNYYEEKLSLYQKSVKLKEIISPLDEIMKEKIEKIM